MLYSPNGSDLPADQGWLAYASFGGSATQLASATGVTLTTDDAVSAGYSSHSPFGTLINPAFPEFDPTLGFEIRFQLQVISESHSSNNRAGFSMIALGTDSFGIEIGFWEDRIWAQSGSDFIQAESEPFDTTASLVNFSLSVLDNNYSLRAGTEEILTGNTRNYSSFGLPYNNPNFLFFGDNTSSASATVELREISVVPEAQLFSVIAGLLSVLLVAVRRRR